MKGQIKGGRGSECKDSKGLGGSSDANLNKLPQCSNINLLRRSKRCNKCHSLKPLQDFHSNPKGKNGYDQRCKECANKLRRKRYDKRKQKKERLKKLRRHFRVLDIETCDLREIYIPFKKGDCVENIISDFIHGVI